VPDDINEIAQVKPLTKEPGKQSRETMIATLDAAHCNEGTAELIGGKPGCDYLITVKTDNPAL
jgi:hypothetical protein